MFQNSGTRISQQRTKGNIVLHQPNQSFILSITKTVQKLLRQTIYTHQQKKSKKNELKVKFKKQKIIQHTQRRYFKHVQCGEAHAQHQMS